MDPVEQKRIEMEAASLARQKRKARAESGRLRAERRELERQAEVLESQKKEMAQKLELLRYAAGEKEVAERDSDNDLAHTLEAVDADPGLPIPADPIPDRAERFACPDCAELIRVGARLCRFCGWEKGEPERAQKKTTTRRKAIEAPQRSSPSARFAAVDAPAGGGDTTVMLVLVGVFAVAVGLGLLIWAVNREAPQQAKPEVIILEPEPPQREVVVPRERRREPVPNEWGNYRKPLDPTHRPAPKASPRRAPVVSPSPDNSPAKEAPRPAPTLKGAGTSGAVVGSSYWIKGQVTNTGDFEALGVRVIVRLYSGQGPEDPKAEQLSWVEAKCPDTIYPGQTVKFEAAYNGELLGKIDFHVVDPIFDEKLVELARIEQGR